MRALDQFENAFGIRISRKKHAEILTLLLCMESVLAFSYLGFIQVAPISVTTLHILVIVAAMLFGPADAAAVALIFGLTSMWKASVTSIEIGDIIFSPTLSGKPFESVIMAVGARLVFAAAAGHGFRLFFSKKRKHNFLGTAVISILSTLLHSLLVYICMAVFFGAADVETSGSFNHALILNNLVLLATTMIVVHSCQKILSLQPVRSFFDKVSIEEKAAGKSRNKVTLVLYGLLLATTVLIAMHFISRLGWFIQEHGGLVSSEYITWTYSLVMQFIVGFIGLFGILTIAVRWIQEYYLSLTIEANDRARENAEIANRSKSAFLFNMSHDIRTPMNAILGYTNIGLRHADDAGRVRDSFGKIKASGDHLLQLINDILEMSRIESGKLELAENPLDLREALKSVDCMSSALAVPKSIDFKMETGLIRTPYVLADELHLNEVLINLISNAVKYTPEGGMVRFRAEQLDDAPEGQAMFRFEVSDNGIGMSEEFQKHLFESFSRENEAVVSKTEGAGLGLSIVKQIVDMAGGTIDVCSTQGKGSVFTVRLPLKLMNEDEERQYVLSCERYAVRDLDDSLEGSRVLLVEDNEMNREIAEEILAEAGMEVESVEDGAVAVRTVEEKGAAYYDFILMDIQMPVMDGYEATARIRALPDGDRVPIIALSANAFKEDVERSLESGMNAHVAKPIDVQKLFAAMHIR